MENKYDVVVIGGGPAGIFAAGFAAINGKRVALLEKNPNLGKKLLITGKGRCNITNSEPEIRSFIDAFGKQGKFLFSSIRKFDNNDIVDFFENKGVPLKNERGGRIFPKSDSASDVLNSLVSFLKKNNVYVFAGSSVLSFNNEGNQINSVTLTNGDVFYADNFIVATGGLSYPTTGSTGEMFNLMKNLGHTIISLRPALVPIIVKEKSIKELQGLALKNVKISLYQLNKKKAEKFGEALFTHEGLSGPIILDLSKDASNLIEKNPKEKINIKIDLKPALEFAVLDKRIQNDFKKNINKNFKNSLNELLPSKMIEYVMNYSKIDPEKKVNSITKDERKQLIHFLKELTFTVKDIGGFNKAIITAGGISLDEVDQKTMRSKIIENLFFAGEILDLDGPTGGYNLQVCWSTGFVAGQTVSVD